MPAAGPAAGARAAKRRACVGAVAVLGRARSTTPGTRDDLARTAAAYGAHVATSAQVVGFLREGERVTGVRVRDLEAGDEFDVRARQVVNATGVWTDDIQELVGGRGQFQVRASKGIHLVVPRDRIHSDTGHHPAHREDPCCS